MRILLLLLLSLGSALPPGSASAQVAGEREGPTTVHPEARDAIDGLWSPYCPGLMLEVCPSPGAAELRDSIQERAERGVEADSIIEGVLRAYGERWRAEPRTRGVGLLAWLLPPAALLSGLALVAWVLARRRREDAAPPPADASPEEEERLRTALRELDDAERPDF